MFCYIRVRFTLNLAFGDGLARPMLMIFVHWSHGQCRYPAVEYGESKLTTPEGGFSLLESSLKTMLREDFQEGFLDGAAANLVVNRNRHLGNLLNSERGVFYAQILYRMLKFRRDYELEPLNEDLYSAVRGAQENLAGDPYPTENFNQDVNQLYEWGLIDRRIEKDRLKSYKDLSRNKFRYRLMDETVLFLEWLEDRARDDLEETGDDTRDLLTDVSGRLKDTLASLSSIQIQGVAGEDAFESLARSVVYNLHQLRDLTGEIAKRLGDLNARLLTFLLSDYVVSEARRIIDELNFYLNTYLIQIDQLRAKIVPAIDELGSEDNVMKLNACRHLLESDHQRVPLLMRSLRLSTSPKDLLDGLKSFYQTAGRLDDICRRVNDSAMRVLGKLSSHLRELERKNVRLDDLRARMEEAMSLGDDDVPHSFLFELLAPAMMPYDPHYWDMTEKAEPPLPRRAGEHVKRGQTGYLEPKRTTSGAARSLDESRLEKLGEWIRRRSSPSGESTSISSGTAESFDDCAAIIDLAKRGLFENGLKLKKIGYSLSIADEEASLSFGEARLTFSKMLVEKTTS